MERKPIIIVRRNSDGSLPHAGEVVIPTEVVVRKVGRFRPNFEATIYNCDAITTVQAKSPKRLGRQIKIATSEMKGVSVAIPKEARLSKRQRKELFEATSRKEKPRSIKIYPRSQRTLESPHNFVLSQIPFRIE